MNDTATTLETLRRRLCAAADGVCEERFASLMHALALSSQNLESSDHRATLTIAITLRPDGAGWQWVARGKVTYPAIDRGEEEPGEFDPNQPTLDLEGEA